MKAKRKYVKGPVKHFAVKKIDLTGLDAFDAALLEQEVQVFLCMDHPHIARLVNVYETSTELSLVMECCTGGELFSRLKEFGPYSNGKAAQATHQMLLAVHYMHCHGVSHRDLKLENFLYDEPQGDTLKLIDFGFSRYFEEAQPSLRRMKTPCGTTHYMAPEVMTKNYTDQCDMWSLGVCVYIMLSGAMPFSGSSAVLKDKIASGSYKPMMSFSWAGASNDAKDFTKALLVKDPSKRLTAKQALQHPWILNNSKQASIDAGRLSSMLSAFQTYKSMPKFRRCCFSAMAWHLPNKENLKLQAEFLAIDKDQGGTISLSELRELFVQKLQVPEEDLINIFDAMDATYDNEIHYSEFIAAMLSTRVDLHDQLMGLTFRNFDEDLSGYITAGNLCESVGSIYAGKGEVCDGEKLDSLLTDADALKDGRVSFPEFAAFVRGVPFDPNVKELTYPRARASPQCCSIM
jgi:calcium-dependent protein kinase